MQSYTVNSVANTNYLWFSVQTNQFLISPISAASDIGVFVFVITWSITDTQGTKTTQTSSFTVNISCALASISPSTTLASSYTANTVLSTNTVMFPTYTQTPSCGYLPHFQYTLDGVTSGAAAWLSAVNTDKLQITPKTGSDDGSY